MNYDPLQNHMLVLQTREDAQGDALVTELCDMWLRMFPVTEKHTYSECES